MLESVHKSRIKVVHIDKLIGLLSIRRVENISNAHIMELFRVMKGVDERVDKGVLWWFDNLE